MAVATELKFAQFMDLLLAALYKLERQQGGGGEYFDLNQIASLLARKAPVPPQWVFDAAKVLEARGFIRCVFTFGAIHAQLTGEGRLHVEEKTDLLKEFNEHPGNLLAAESSIAPSRLPEPIEKERRAVFALLDKIEELLRQDPSLNQQEKEELLDDAQVIRGQLKKREPNRAVLAALLEPFSRVASVTSLVANLIQIINYS